jgi:hypothetical protein
VLNGKWDWVTVDIHRRVAEFFETYWLMIGCQSRAELVSRRQIAKAREFFPPGAWDYIDDPEEVPDTRIAWGI